MTCDYQSDYYMNIKYRIFNWMVPLNSWNKLTLKLRFTKIWVAIKLLMQIDCNWLLSILILFDMKTYNLINLIHLLIACVWCACGPRPSSLCLTIIWIMSIMIIRFMLIFGCIVFTKHSSYHWFVFVDELVNMSSTRKIILNYLIAKI